ncbi:hypothetical protein AMK59_8407 [Oryctes borbonicus]|uniref:Transmembrane protein 256 homolog n=1 Tax=Oryctes borbonicus TaxID=1629725 RepID=A0A0T6AUL6_9SCAR|nr:hypothetical protein AMK59_8407 [Oryctes borbonicus]
MTFSNAFNYILYDNPLSQTVIGVTKSTVEMIKPTKEITPTTIKVITERIPLYKQVAEHGPFIRIAGIMGASAVALGAYGAHRKYPKDRVDELKPIFETANRFHFFHTLALLGVPFSRNPKISAMLFICGTGLFTGACYYRAFTGKDTYGKLAPVGGTLLIIAWLSMVV